MSFLGLGGKKEQAQQQPQLSPDQAQIVSQIKSDISQEIATNYATALVNSLSDNCFERCISLPTASFSKDNEKCVTDCTGKFMRSWNIISQAYVSRINQK
ncbi:hypothetical protein CAS74_001153 [Pichia kudriavzevii]|uniref:Mitochondrial import inner membrane translocase subunit n=1 Tax=Pichia kudriavzevii TaxID=4909 RepID=A0A099P0T2_PICKU|nr:uncharacterized protein C5L36_0C11350 [Pichia kudriavzevii]AWU77230.1 hypothetical protein C5L36_0C11350 [Pichia kudriavzevii]KGK38673.1 hypothetical protein JL09_g2188 [Pichia kudriavzevii]ONH76407.1 Mitochondrial import inner membrane translocase subunit TIM13 [Pichia kudriavzevii]OUT24763.1 hypothetical protein CAS74_001153 [Pichia kudriavzevii]